MTAVLLTVGGELLIGQVVNTNAAWLGERLGLAGCAVTRAETVGDEPDQIAQLLAEGSPRPISSSSPRPRAYARRRRWRPRRPFRPALRTTRVPRRAG